MSYNTKWGNSTPDKQYTDHPHGWLLDFFVLSIDSIKAAEALGVFENNLVDHRNWDMLGHLAYYSDASKSNNEQNHYDNNDTCSCDTSKQLLPV